jgi:hypothetical protein
MSMSALKTIGLLAFIAAGFALANVARAEGVGTAGGMHEYGPLQGYIQLEGTITPNSTINAQPACRVQSRYLCKLGNGSCDVPVRRSCGQNETRRQTGVNIFCDRWVCN